MPYRLVTVLACVCALSVAGSSNAQDFAAGAEDTFAIANDGDGILLPVKIVGKDGRFILHTGATITCFDLSLISTEPMKTVTVQSSSGAAKLSFYETPDAYLVRENLHDSLQKILGKDLSDTRKVTNSEVYGVIGMDFLCDKVLKI